MLIGFLRRLASSSLRFQVRPFEVSTFEFTDTEIFCAYLISKQREEMETNLRKRPSPGVETPISHGSEYTG
jgi:hypothetical protein